MYVPVLRKSPLASEMGPLCKSLVAGPIQPFVCRDGKMAAD